MSLQRNILTLKPLHLLPDVTLKSALCATDQRAAFNMPGEERVGDRGLPVSHKAFEVSLDNECVC